MRAIRRTREIVSTEPLASAAALEFQPGPEVNTDEELAGMDPGDGGDDGPSGVFGGDGHRARQRAGPAAAGAGRCGPAGGRRLGAAADPASQHQCPGDHGRRALRGLHALGLWITFVTSDRGDTIRTYVLLIYFMD